MASKERGKISDHHYNILRTNHDFMVKEIDSQHVVDCLFSKHVLDESDLEEISATQETKGTIAATKKFLEILYNSGSHAYDGFLDSLNKNGYRHVTDILLSTAVVTPQDPYAWIEELDENKKGRALTEIDLINLSNHFADGWEAVMIKLGNTEAQIYQDRMKNQNPNMHIFISLNRWRQRVASHATVLAVLTAMKSCPHAKIEWTGVKNTICSLNHQTA